jgi:hypothetical protein
MIMQQLKTFVITMAVNYKETEFDINEKDMDDSICYDVFCEGIYLLSISPVGEILYNSSSNQLGEDAVQKLVEEIIKKI